MPQIRPGCVKNFITDECIEGHDLTFEPMFGVFIADN